MSKKLNIVLLIFIIATGVLLRLWKLSELFHFTYDEEIFAFVGKRMFVNYHIPLIGGVTPMHVHVAPYFYWLSGFFLFLSKLNPLGWGVVSAVLSAVTMGVLYKLGKTIFDKRVSLIAVFIYNFSFYMNIFDRHYWGLVFDGMLSLLTFYFLYKIIQGKEKYLVLLTGVLAFGIHTDLSTLTLVVLTVISWIIFKPKVSGKILSVGILVFLISFMPLVLFDLRHDFSNSRGILQYIEEVHEGRKGVLNESPVDALLFIPRGLARTLYVYGNSDLARQYSYCANHVIQRLHEVPWWMIIGVISSFVFLFWLAKHNKQKGEKIGLQLILLLFASTFIGVSIYGVLFKGDLFDHYLGTLFPIFILSVAFILSKIIKNRLVMTIILLMFSISNLLLLLKAQHRFGYADKKQAVEWSISTLNDKEFSLDVIGDCFRYNGYRYLFYLYGKEPAKSYVDANFTHLYDKPPATSHPRYLVVFTNPDWVETESYANEYNKYKQKLVTSAKFGTIEVLIVDNQNLDFVGKF